MGARRGKVWRTRRGGVPPAGITRVSGGARPRRPFFAGVAHHVARAVADAAGCRSDLLPRLLAGTGCEQEREAGAHDGAEQEPGHRRNVTAVTHGSILRWSTCDR